MGKSNNSSTTTDKVKAAKAKSTPVKKGKPLGADTAGMRILKAIATQNAMGKEKADRTVVQKLVGMTSKKSYDTTLLNLKNKDLVMYDTPTVWLTEHGLETVGPDAVAVPKNNDAMQDKLKEGVKGKVPRQIFDILTNGNAYARAELAAMMEMDDNKSFGTYVSALSKVVERVEGKKIRLPDLAFPCGRPCDKA